MRKSGKTRFSAILLGFSTFFYVEKGGGKLWVGFGLCGKLRGKVALHILYLALEYIAFFNIAFYFKAAVHNCGVVLS